MKRFLWILTIPFGLVLVVLTIANLHRVSLDLWPFPLQLHLRLSVLLLLSLLVGFMLGGGVAWWSAGKHRRRMRRAERRVRDLEEENRRLRPPRAAPNAVRQSPIPVQSNPPQSNSPQSNPPPPRNVLPAA